VEEEVGRFRSAVATAGRELEELHQRHGDALGADDVQILEVHRSYLQDPSFLGGVEKIVRSELLVAESAVARVVHDFERVMVLVEDQDLRDRAEDLRDVGLRVLRWMRAGQIATDASPAPPREPYVLVTQRLAIADMVARDTTHLLGILAAEGGVAGHAAILARSLGIPTLTGLEGISQRVAEGDFVILDATEGEVRIRPPERVLREFEEAARALPAGDGWEQTGEDRTADGQDVVLVGSCGTLADVDRCTQLGLGGVGVYRTELLFVAGEIPSGEMVRRHYREVLKRAGDSPVTFRLLDTDQEILRTGGEGEERNPALGRRSLRALLAEGELLALQIRGLLRAASGTEALNILVPFVTLGEELAAVREMVAAQHRDLTAEGETPPPIHLGVSVEVPALALALADMLPQVDFVVVALDDLAQHLLAADRDSLAVRSYYQACHPALFRLLASLHETASQAGTPIGLFGETVADVVRLPFYLGVGYRTFSVAPVRVPSFRRALAGLHLDRCRTLANRVLALADPAAIQEELTRDG
jgi:phosphotransferase system enzyme I (PtsI)